MLALGGISGQGRIANVAVTDEALAHDFEAHRSRLIGLSYRLTGRLADAEDAVQEAWLRLASSTARDDVRDLGGWLTTVVSRICLDRMRSASARRERYVGPWLPEPLVTSMDDTNDPLNVIVNHEDIRMAALRLLHELSPDQRLAFVLHDSFEVPFADIAEILGCTPAAARQHASRARRAMSDSAPAPRVPLAEQRQAMEAFLRAVSSRDINAVARILHPEAALFGDSGGKARTARRPVCGQDKVSRFVLGLVTKYGGQIDERLADIRPVLVNGDLGIVVPGSPEATPPTESIAPRVMTFAIRDQLTEEIFDIVNPDKLARVTF